MEPETIEIKVSEYYDQPKYYGDMPESGNPIYLRSNPKAR